ncbi:MAG TPA: fumarylacetoacetate hydrolase family protein [Verrucomicrobiae bacterium]|nr:fumarylacetoacetate hydrolase family protein [Verrucomicrobiae bacterium]
MVLIAYGMVEIGRFRHGQRVFSGTIEGDRVTRRPPSGEPTGGGTTGEVWDYGDLVLLSPVEPVQIIDASETPTGFRFRLRPPSSVGPHRAMVSVPRDRRPVIALPRLGWVLGRGLYRAAVEEARDAVQGCVTAIIFQEDSPFPTDPYSLATVSHEGFTTLGAAVAQGSRAPDTPPILWHNGRGVSPHGTQGQVFDPGSLLADLSGWIRLGATDLILVGPDRGGVNVRPGDHLECRCPPLRPTSVNIGLRGSA